MFGAHWIDAGESPKHVVEALLRFDALPTFVLYDNACHLRHYAMSRYPHLFFDVVFLCDKFHWPNHTACSPMYNPKVWNHIDKIKRANTSAMEQVNRVLQLHLDRFLSFCSANNALNILEFFISVYNSSQNAAPM